MRFMLLVRADQETERGALPSKELIEQMGKFNAQMANAGVLLEGEGLHASSKGARVHFSGGERKVVRGPFPDPKELIAGYWLIQAQSMDEAIDWAKRCPFGQGVVEIRQVFETSDFPAELISPEVAAQEQALRESLRSNTPKG